MEIITIKRERHPGEVNAIKAAPQAENNIVSGNIYGNSPDADFMRNCSEIDHNPPKTWEKYDVETSAGVKKVIEMEYRELMSATTPEETKLNIYHLSVALLRLWRIHHEHQSGSARHSGAN